MREQQILHKIKKGDQQALNAFIRDLYPSVYSFAFHKMQGDDSAKDITQEVFVRFIRQLPMYHSQGKTLHYLYRITSNLCHDYHRKMQRDQHADIDNQENLLSADCDVHEAILDQMRNEELMKQRWNKPFFSAKKSRSDIYRKTAPLYCSLSFAICGWIFVFI